MAVGAGLVMRLSVGGTGLEGPGLLLRSISGEALQLGQGRARKGVLGSQGRTPHPRVELLEL